MQSDQFNSQVKLFWNGLCLFSIALIVIGSILTTYVLYPESSLFQKNTTPEQPAEESVTDSLETDVKSEVVNGIHQPTGFVEDVGMREVINNCTNCHSAKLVTQNRMSRSAWLSTIRWMQETQNLWDLGANESVILDYLAENYAPQSKGRRQNIEVENWYVLHQ